MRAIVQTSKFKRDTKRMKKRGKNIEKLMEVVALLANDEDLPTALRDNSLVGNYVGFRECHIEPDWLLVYKKVDDETIELNELYLAATGTHADLF